MLNHISIADLDDAEKQFSSWREKYNFKRPHEALGMRCPGEVYHPSSRKLPASIPAFTYGGEYHIVKVNSWGYVRFDRWQIFLSGTMRNEYVEFRPNPHGDSFFVCFRNFKIAEFDANSGELISRFIARL
ncbi:MAG: integrase core domain-containing protein [Oscillospiraceae bacterium]|nr:integrase core domain-containing protein [Oscillospiraceae bacterium]